MNDKDTAKAWRMFAHKMDNAEWRYKRKLRKLKHEFLESVTDVRIGSKVEVTHPSNIRKTLMRVTDMEIYWDDVQFISVRGIALRLSDHEPYKDRTQAGFIISEHHAWEYRILE